MLPRRRFIAVKVLLLILVALILQLTFVSDVPVFGGVGDLLLLLAITTGLVEGPDRGAIVGFVAGIAYDLVLDTPFGLSPLTYTVIGYAVGLASASLTRPPGWLPVIFAVVASVAGAALYLGAARLVGMAYPVGGLPGIAAAMALWSAVLVLPLRGLLRRIFGRNVPDRIELAFR